MKSQRSFVPLVAFWGVCVIAIAWIVATILFEFHLGWPATNFGLAKRIVGWAVELWLVRTLVLGSRRCAAAIK